MLMSWHWITLNLGFPGTFNFALMDKPPMIAWLKHYCFLLFFGPLVGDPCRCVWRLLGFYFFTSNRYEVFCDIPKSWNFYSFFPFLRGFRLKYRKTILGKRSNLSKFEPTGVHWDNRSLWHEQRRFMRGLLSLEIHKPIPRIGVQ